MGRGKVFFVGAGPGDPQLITVKGLEAIKTADVVIYDRLANPQLLKWAKEDVHLIYCGKETNLHTLSQDEINQAIVREASEGQLVVRLKGGDPNIFGRVGEEAQICAQNHIPFEIVPGITSGIAAAAYAGIPLTHREYNSSVVFLTGHRCVKNEKLAIEWEKVSAIDTLVIYMGLKNLPYIQQQLLLNGKDPQTPVAIVKSGTTGTQQTLIGTIANIADKVQEANIKSPAVIIIGHVVSLREELNWFEHKPLFGKKIAYITDSKVSSTDQIAYLESQGAAVNELTLNVVKSSYTNEILYRLKDFSYILFTNAQEVDAFIEIIKEARMDIRSIPSKMIALGQVTAERLENKGLIPEAILPTDDNDASAVNDFIQHLHHEHILILNPKSRCLNDEELSSVKITRGSLTISLFEAASDHHALRDIDIDIDIIVLSTPHSVQAAAALISSDGALFKDKQWIAVGKETGAAADQLGLSIRKMESILEFEAENVEMSFLNF